MKLFLISQMPFPHRYLQDYALVKYNPHLPPRGPGHGSAKETYWTNMLPYGVGAFDKFWLHNKVYSDIIPCMYVGKQCHHGVGYFLCFNTSQISVNSPICPEGRWGYVWVVHYSLIWVYDRVATVFENPESPGFGKRKLQALESPWIWVALVENPNQNEHFVITGHNTFNESMFENNNGGSIFPQKQIL